MIGFNEGRLPSFSRVWALDPRAGAGYDEAEEDAREEEAQKGKGAAFPHAPSLPPGARDLAHIEASPGGNDLVVAFVDEMIPLGDADARAPRSIDERRLALGDVEGRTDLLCVSFSSTDIIGHRYGPESQEAADAFVRLDASLARLLALLDRRIGRGRWLLALTADHGAAPIPEWAKRVGLGGDRLEPAIILERLASALGKDVVQGVVEANVYFSPASPTVREASADPDARRRLEERARDALIGVPGIWRAYTRTQLLAGQVPDDGPGVGAVRSFDATRSGDVVIQLDPNWLVGKAGEAPKASHGTPWTYDQRVPLILFGNGVRAGLRPEPASVVDLVPTLCALLHLTPPAACEGAARFEAIDLDVWRATSPLR